MRVVVVGAGPAGLAFAAAAAHAHEVTVLEAGPRRPTTPGPIRQIVDDPHTVRRRAVRRAAAGPFGDYLFGVGVGGGGLVNGGLVVGDPDPGVADLIPIEPPKVSGPVARGLLATHRDARVARLVARGGGRVDLADELLAAAPVEVRPDARVDRIALDGSRAVGVTVGDEQIPADLVVVCAGAIGTPLLLLRSGVRCPDAAGEELIGAGLHDTTTVPITLRLTRAAAEEAAAVPPTTVTAETDRHRIIAVDDTGDGRHAVLLVCLTAARSRGRVRLDPASGRADVDFGQLAHPDDLDALTAAVLDALATLTRPAWSSVVEQVAIDDEGTPPAPIVAEPSSIVPWARTRLAGTYHAAASCAAACDGSGAVRGYRGLVVADASILPAAPPRNPFLTVLARATALGRVV